MNIVTVREFHQYTVKLDDFNITVYFRLKDSAWESVAHYNVVDQTHASEAAAVGELPATLKYSMLRNVPDGRQMIVGIYNRHHENRKQSRPYYLGVIEQGHMAGYIKSWFNDKSNSNRKSDRYFRTMRQYGKNDWTVEAHFIIPEANDRQLAKKRFRHIEFGKLIPAAGNFDEIKEHIDALESELACPNVEAPSADEDLETVSDMESVELQQMKRARVQIDSDEPRAKRICVELVSPAVSPVALPAHMTAEQFNKLMAVLQDEQKAKSILTLLGIN